MKENMNLRYLIFLLALPLSATQQRLTLDKKSVLASEQLGLIKVRFNEHGYNVIQNGKRHSIEKHSVDPMIRSLTLKQLQKFQQKGMIVVNKADNGDFTLKAMPNMKGGGILGANVGFWLANFAFRLAAHTGIVVVSVCTGPLAPATFGALEGMLAAPIEAGAAAAGIAGGIAAGVATGPV